MGNTLTKQQERILNALSSRYGKVRAARERHGLHFYIPCPVCLKRHGKAETYKRHLSINADSLDAMGDTFRTFCPKCGTHFSLKYLLGGSSMDVATLERDKPAGVVIGVNFDGAVRGTFKPGSTSLEAGEREFTTPGTCIPLSSLASDSPPIHYLRQRAFDITRLEQMFKAEWCVRGNVLGSAGSKFPMNCTNRIIFYGRMFGTIRAWQARIVDYIDEKGNRWIYDMDSEWRSISTAEERANGTAKRNVAKYYTTPNVEKSVLLLNLDIALQESARLGFGKTVILCEGLLDAARIGPLAVPLLGKTLSTEQVRLLKAFCDRVILMLDSDAEEDMKKIQAELSGCLAVSIVRLVGYKDPGDAPSEYLWQEIAQVFNFPAASSH